MWKTLSLRAFLYGALGLVLATAGLLAIDLMGDVHPPAQAGVSASCKAAFLVSIIAALMLGYLIRRIVKPLEKLHGYLERMAQGDLNVNIEIDHRDEIAKILEAVKGLQTKLGFDLSEARRLAEENLRVKIALDTVSTNVMIADNDRRIVYMNKAVVDMLSRAEDDIRKQLPNFSVSRLLGASMDDFHKNPHHQKHLLATFTTTHRAQVGIGGRTFVLTANPVLNERGERLGSVVEWLDRTAELAAEGEVNALVQAATRGELSQRVPLEGKTGFIREIADGINKMLDAIAEPVFETQRMLAALARGDLTSKITAEYQGAFAKLRDDLNLTVDYLASNVSAIKEAADSIRAAAKEIALGNSDLSQRTEEQASSLEETASSMEELSSTVKQNADNAKQANQMAVMASDVAVRGGSVVQQVVKTMDEINESARKIVDIIGVIDGIAFQTNILALNAAVEAARAGEQGRGFAVVAGEVRNLAQRSAAAAKEIKALINDSVEKVEGGSKRATEAGRTMEEVVNASKRVTDIMAEIAAASQEQSSGIEQVNQAIGQMDYGVQQNASLVEQAAAAAESLEEQAANLIQTVARFRLADQDATSQDVVPAVVSRVLPSAKESTALPSSRKPNREQATPQAQVRALSPKPRTKAAAVAELADEDWQEF